MGIRVPLKCCGLDLGFGGRGTPVFILLSFIFCDLSVSIPFHTFLVVEEQFSPPHSCCVSDIRSLLKCHSLARGTSCRLILRCVHADYQDDKVGVFLSDLASSYVGVSLGLPRCIPRMDFFFLALL